MFMPNIESRYTGLLRQNFFGKRYHINDKKFRLGTKLSKQDENSRLVEDMGYVPQPHLLTSAAFGIEPNTDYFSLDLDGATGM